jgi:hypothetical protein
MGGAAVATCRQPMSRQAVTRWPMTYTEAFDAKQIWDMYEPRWLQLRVMMRDT